MAGFDGELEDFLQDSVLLEAFLVGVWLVQADRSSEVFENVHDGGGGGEENVSRVWC